MLRLKPLPLSWLTGLIVAVLLTGTGYYAGVLVERHEAAQEKVEGIRVAIARLRQERAQLQVQFDQIKQQAFAAMAEADAAHQRQRQQSAQRLAELAPPQAGAAFVEEKETAWKAFFRPLKGCDTWRNEQHMVECQNQVIRARRAFEERWQAGDWERPHS